MSSLISNLIYLSFAKAFQDISNHFSLPLTSECLTFCETSFSSVIVVPAATAGTLSEPFFHQKLFKLLSLQTLAPLNKSNTSNLYIHSAVQTLLIHTYGSIRHLAESEFRIVFTAQEWQVKSALPLLCLTNDPQQSYTLINNDQLINLRIIQSHSLITAGKQRHHKESVLILPHTRKLPP